MDSQMVLIINIIVFSVFQFLFSSSVVVDSKSITLSLSRHKQHSSSSKREELQRLVRASSARAQSFQQYYDNIPRSYGGYSLSLSFGTPPQTLSYIMDTGSSLTWFPCTSDFKCEHCNFKGTIRPFIPKESSSSEKVPCNSTRCKWLFPNHTCTSQEYYLYCGYDITYGLGETMGFLLSEILTFPDDDDETRLDNFAVGCSDYAYGAPSGVAGFGRGNESLPSQMELDSFSYSSGDLVLITKGGGGGGSNGNSAPTTVQYTPFIPNPESRPDYYYVRLQNITVGNVNITVPDVYQIPNVEGNGGTIVDSGISLTVMEESVFGLVAKEFERQIIGKNNINSRNTTTESETGLGLCLNVWSFNDIPTLSLHFRGGAIMDLPMQNYFRGVEYHVVCLLMTAHSGKEGPAIILGNFFQQNFYVEFDLKYNRLGFYSNIVVHATPNDKKIN